MVDSLNIDLQQVKRSRLSEVDFHDLPFGKVYTDHMFAHIELIGYEGKDHLLPPVENSVFANKVYQELDGIKHGTLPDKFGWIVKM